MKPTVLEKKLISDLKLEAKTASDGHDQVLSSLMIEKRLIFLSCEIRRTRMHFDDSEQGGRNAYYARGSKNFKNFSSLE